MTKKLYCYKYAPVAPFTTLHFLRNLPMMKKLEYLSLARLSQNYKLALSFKTISVIFNPNVGVRSFNICFFIFTIKNYLEQRPKSADFAYIKLQSSIL